MPYLILVDTELPPDMSEMLAESCDVRVWEGDATDPDLLARADGFLTYGHPPFAGDTMDRMPNLRVISNFGVGVDHVNLDDARVRGIPVGNTPGFVDGATADMTFTLLMALARNVVIGDRYARSPEFVHYDPNLFHGHEVYGSTLGIIGMGRIGREVARRTQGFDMTVLYHNRNRDPDSEASLGVTYASLDELLEESDFVSLNVPLTPETDKMIGAAELEKMKSTAYLINLARGGVVDHDALVDALRSGTIAGAALDVTEPEPLPRDHPLLELENVILTPHLGSATRQTRSGMSERTVANLLAGLEGKELPSRVG